MKQQEETGTQVYQNALFVEKLKEAELAMRLIIGNNIAITNFQIGESIPAFEIEFDVKNDAVLRDYISSRIPCVYHSESAYRITATVNNCYVRWHAPRTEQASH